jgi:RNA polymerase sigma factor (sigma-70 family)
MQDRDIVGAIVAGEPSGLATAYDRYAPALYAYCRSLLAGPADAADAVQDTFIAAIVKLPGLREPDLLRPWLYAVARNECHRRLVAGVSAPPPEEVAEVMDDLAPVGSEAERAELRALVTAALSGMTTGEREAVELTLRHGMGAAGLASMLGVPRPHAQGLISRARARFEGKLGALLVARSGRDFCPGLDLLLTDWDGRLTALVCTRVGRHIRRCRVCADRKDREMSPAMLQAMLPVFVLPSGLWERLLHLATDTSPAVESYRGLVADRAGLFARTGFPEPVRPPAPPAGAKSYTLAAVGAVAFLALVGGGTVYSLHLMQHHRPVAVAKLPAGMPGTTAPPESVSSHSSPAPTPREAATPSAPPTTPGATTSPSPSPSRSRGPSPSPSSPSPSPSPSTPPPPTPVPSPAALTASPSSVTLAEPSGSTTWSGSFTITASGGTATFSVSDPAAALTVSPLSGSLADGQSAVISVSAPDGADLGFTTVLTVDPGGIPVTIVYPPAGLGAVAQLAMSRPGAALASVSPGGAGQPAVSARSLAAASVMLLSLPYDTSRGRYFIPQSGASTSRPAGT